MSASRKSALGKGNDQNKAPEQKHVCCFRSGKGASVAGAG